MDSGIILFIRKPMEAEVYKYAAAEQTGYYSDN